MDFRPQTPKELSRANLWPGGVYNFRITAATEEVSKRSKGQQFKLTILISNGNGNVNQKFLTEYLPLSNMKKLRAAVMALGLGAQYQAGHLDAREFIGKSGTCQVAQEEGKGDFEDKNIIKYFHPPQGSVARSA